MARSSFSAPHPVLSLVLGTALAGVAWSTGCAQLLGTDFEVVPLEGGGGAAGHGGAGGAGGGEVVTLWEGDYPFDIVVDDTYVTWSSPGGPATPGGIRRMPKEGGAAEPFTPELPGANRLLQEGSTIYFSAATDAPTSWRVGRCEMATLECVDLATPSEVPIGIALYGNDLYFTVRPNLVYRVPKMGGQAAQLVLTVLPPATADLLLIHQGSMYGSSLGGGRVWRTDVPLAAMPTVYTTEIEAANALAPFGNTVAAGQYKASGAIYTLGAFESPTPLVDDQDQVADMTFFDGWLYWATFGAGAITRLPAFGGTPETIAIDEPFANGVAVDATHVYFTRHIGGADGGAVRRAPRP